MLADRDRRGDVWKALKPLLLRDPLLYRLGKDHLLLSSAATDWLIDGAHGLYRQHGLGCPNTVEPARIDGDILIDLARDCTCHRGREWELLEQIGRAGLFIEVSALERAISDIRDEAYDRDDVSDWFAFIGGHQVPVSYSVEVIFQALLASEPRIREHAAAALGYLIRHRGHRCYSRAEDSALEAARKTLEEVSETRKDAQLLATFFDCVKWR